MSVRHFIPAAFVSGLLLSILTGAVTGFWWPAVAVVVPYMLVVLTTAVVVPLSPLERLAGIAIQPLLQISYGVGTLAGLVMPAPLGDVQPS